MKVMTLYLSSSSGFSRTTRWFMSNSVVAPDVEAGTVTETKGMSLPGRHIDELNASRFALYIGLEENVVLIASSKPSGAGFERCKELIVTFASLTVF